MSRDLSKQSRPSILTRRSFLGAAAGTAAVGFLRTGDAFAGRAAGGAMLRDYVGRLCYNENPLGPSPIAMAAITESVPMGHRYPDWYGESLCNDLASLYGVPSSQVIVGCGGTEMLRLAALSLADPAGNVVSPYPSYSQFPSDCAFLGATVRYSSLDPDYRVDLNDLASMVDGATTAVCITNPNNPTATVLSAAAIASFVDSLPSHVAVVIDEAYHDYVHDPGHQSAIELVRQGKNVVVIRTFSKAFGMAGIRVGYAVGWQSLISGMGSWQIFATVSRLGLEGSRAALLDDQHIIDTVALNDAAKEYCFTSFGSMGLEYIPSEANFFMVDVGQSASAVAAELGLRGILVRTGWGMPNHLRVSTGTMEEMESFITALQEILASSGTAEPGLPRVDSLDGNFPNPWKTATRISYAVENGGEVRLRIFDLRGRLVRTLVDRYREPGRYSLDWDGTNSGGAPVASGSYFYRLETGRFVQTRRMILTR